MHKTEQEKQQQKNTHELLAILYLNQTTKVLLALLFFSTGMKCMNSFSHIFPGFMFYLYVYFPSHSPLILKAIVSEISLFLQLAFLSTHKHVPVF